MIRLRAVGECVIEVGEGRVVGPDAEMAFAVLLVLALARGRPLGRQWLVDLLWPATTEARARHNLRQTLYKLRQLGVPVEGRGHQLLLHFEEIADSPLLDEEGEAVQQALLRPDQPFGEFLAGYTPQVSGAFQLWLDEQRDQMNGRLRRAVLSLLLDERRRGNWGAVETLARKCLQLDPLNEEATLALAEATALTGSKRAALAILDAYVEELGGSGVGAGDLRLPAAVLRKRIAERLHPPTSLAVVESCFVGRGDSMALLGDRLRSARAGRGRALLVWGEAGMGKSRLVAEFGQLCILDGVHTVRVVCQLHDLERPLSVFMDAVPLLLSLPGALGCSPESMAYLKRLTEHDPEMTEPSEATREAELLFAGVRQAILDLVDAVSEETALVLCVEDVHWLDAQSWRVLRELIDWSDTRRVLVLLTARQPHPTPSPPERPSRSLELLRLGPLDQTDSLVLFEAVTAGYATPTVFRDWCVHVAEGNPFFVRALAIHWMETGELGAPTSLAELIGQRIARLGETPLLTLQACAVLGKASTLDRLELVLEHKRHVLVESVDILSEHGLLAVDGAGVPCRHDLIAQSALGRLALPSRKLLHRCAAEVLQAEIERSQSAALLWECAQQWHSAGEGDRAMALVKSCAGHLLEVGLPAEAAEIYEKALELCETDEERLEMLELLAQAAQLSGKWKKTLEAIAGHDLVEKGPVHDECTDLTLLSLEARWRTGVDIRSLLDEAKAYAFEPSTLLRHRARAAVLAMTFADNLCEEDTARSLHELFQDVYPVSHDVHTHSHRQIVNLIYHASYGSLPEAVAIARHIVRATSPTTDAAEWVRNVSRASIPLRRAGDFSEAASAIREALYVAEKYRYASAATSATDILATIAIEQGRLDTAHRWYDRALYWMRQQEGSSAISSIGLLGVKLSLLSARELTLPEWQAPTLETIMQETNVRHRAESLSLLLARQLVYNDALDPGAVSALRDVLVQTRRHGGQDFPTEVLATCLYRMDQRDTAVTELSRYVSSDRRERYPFRLVLPVTPAVPFGVPDVTATHGVRY